MSDESDAKFFVDNPTRQAHIRMPSRVLRVNKQRAAGYVGECEAEFLSLGAHKRADRRILIWRVPETNPHYDVDKRPLMKIPFIAEPDEVLEDTDDVLLPLLHSIMEGQSA